jgi:Zn-dependent alcohol dehydrogenase
VRAAVLHSIDDKKLDIRDDVQTVGPDAGEVLIKLRAEGMCHSDL